MSQKISRDRHAVLEGFLGVYLQEGSPLVDADWNEGQDIHLGFLRELARNIGVQGCRGSTLTVSSAGLEADGTVLVDVEGGEEPFWVDGLPLRFPRSRRLRLEASQGAPSAAQVDDDGPMAMFDRRGAEDDDGGELTLSLVVRRDGVSALERPSLRDPALPPGRGTFRKTLSTAFLATSGEGPVPGTTLRLTVTGPYSGSEDALYRVEPHGWQEGIVGGPAASLTLLWDDYNAAIRAEVVEEASWMNPSENDEGV